MTVIRLIHWNAEEVEARAGDLRGRGYSVACFSNSRANPKELLDRLPDVFVIDLGGFRRRGANWAAGFAG